MELICLPFQQNCSAEWDDFVGKSWNATFLQSRRFLSYHGERFKDKSVFIVDDKNKIVGVFPAAENPFEPTEVVSHPGITYGGVLHQGALRGNMMIQTFKVLISYYSNLGYNTLKYKAVPSFYHKVPSCDDLYAMFRLKSELYRRDLSATIDLSNRPRLTKGRKSSLSKAKRFGIEILSGPEYIECFWSILENNLASKYGNKPVHSVDEMKLLYSRFPDDIKCIVGMIEGKVVAGTVLFYSLPTIHTQYIAGNDLGHDSGAIDTVLEHCIEDSRNMGARYFDFGINTENEGHLLNDGLYSFKASFGAGATMHEFYKILLE